MCLPATALQRFESVNSSPISAHAKHFPGDAAVSTVRMGFLLIQLVFTVLLGRKGPRISAALSGTKDVHSRNVFFRHGATSCAAARGRSYCARNNPEQPHHWRSSKVFTQWCNCALKTKTISNGDRIVSYR